MYATQRRNRRKTSPTSSFGYLTREQRKALEFYESKRLEQKENESKVK